MTRARKKSGFTGVDEMLAPLFADSRRAIKAAATKRASGYSKRLAVRATFALIEGMIHVQKQRALKHAKEMDYSPSELALLREESYRLNNRGDIDVVQSFLRVPENLLFAWKMARGADRSNFQIDLGSDGWRCLKESLKVRNRLTHPRSEQDLEVSRDEINALLAAQLWVLENEFQTIAAGMKHPRRLKGTGERGA